MCDEEQSDIVWFDVDAFQQLADIWVEDSASVSDLDEFIRIHGYPSCQFCDYRQQWSMDRREFVEFTIRWS